VRRVLLVGMFSVEPLRSGHERLSWQRLAASGGGDCLFAGGDYLQRVWKPILPGDTDMLRRGNVAGQLPRPPVRNGFGNLHLLALMRRCVSQGEFSEVLQR
jgi:hypothetical protein